MKRVTALALCLALLICALACTRPKPDETKPTVVCTIFPQYDFVRAIAGDRVNLVLLAKPGSEVHGFDPSLAEMSLILESDLFIYVGGETDQWTNDLLHKSGRDLFAVALIDLVQTVDEEHTEGMQGKTEDEPEADEHVWTSPKNAMRIVDGLCDALCRLLPDEADAMRKNAEDYKTELCSLDRDLHAVMQEAKRTTVVFAERFPFRYLTDDLGLSYYAALPGCSSNEEVSLSTISGLIEIVRREKVPCVFTIEFSDGRIAETIAEATGCSVYELHSCHNVSREDFDAGVTYLDLMRRNLESLKKAVN